MQQALDCVIDGRLNVDGYRPSPDDAPYTADINGGLSVPFGRGSTLSLLVIIRYQLIDEGGDRDLWTPRTTGYEYAIMDRDEREIIAFHWHPNARSSVPWPHLHMGTVLLSATYKGLHKAHIRTEQVALPDVLWFAITELNVPPTRRHVDNWENVLARTRHDLELLSMPPS